MHRPLRLVRQGFELGGAVSLLLSLGVAGIVASVATFAATLIADFPSWLQVPIFVGLLLIALAACVASWGAWRARQTATPFPQAESTVGKVDIGQLTALAEEDSLPEQVVGKLIRAEDYAPVVHGHIFERCNILGTVHLPGSHLSDSKWLLGSLSS